MTTLVIPDLLADELPYAGAEYWELMPGDDDPDG